MPKEIDTLPHDIAEPGRYRLSSSLHQEGEYALRVSAPGVHLDLGGHTLSCANGTTILLAAGEFTLEGGSLQGEPVALAAEPQARADRCRFERLEVEGGLFVGGDEVTMRDCRIQGGSFGIRCGRRARLEECRVKGALVGIEVGAGSEVHRCQVLECEDGVYAFGTRSSPSHLEGILVYECAGTGIRLDGPGTVYRCEAHNNGREQETGGIVAGPASVVAECEAYGNRGGDIVTVDPCELRDNRVTGSG